MKALRSQLFNPQELQTFLLGLIDHGICRCYCIAELKLRGMQQGHFIRDLVYTRIDLTYDCRVVSLILISAVETEWFLARSAVDMDPTSRTPANDNSLKASGPLRTTGATPTVNCTRNGLVTHLCRKLCWVKPG